MTDWGRVWISNENNNGILIDYEELWIFLFGLICSYYRTTNKYPIAPKLNFYNDDAIEINWEEVGPNKKSFSLNLSLCGKKNEFCGISNNVKNNIEGILELTKEYNNNNWIIFWVMDQ